MAAPHTNRGGAREGAGRKKIGTARALRITLPEGEWDRIDQLIADGTVSNQSEYFRLLHQNQVDPKPWKNKLKEMKKL